MSSYPSAQRSISRKRHRESEVGSAANASTKSASSSEDSVSQSPSSGRPRVSIRSPFPKKSRTILEDEEARKEAQEPIWARKPSRMVSIRFHTLTIDDPTDVWKSDPLLSVAKELKSMDVAGDWKVGEESSNLPEKSSKTGWLGKGGSKRAIYVSLIKFQSLNLMYTIKYTGAVGTV